MQPEIIDVPEVRRLPDQSENLVVPFADMLLTSLFVYNVAILSAEHPQGAADATPVHWHVREKSESRRGPRSVVAVSPELGYFRAILARFGAHYMGGQLYNGYALKFLRQRGRVHRCYIYMSNGGHPGFWIEIYAGLTEMK